MKKLHWRIGSSEQLSHLLMQATLEKSTAIGSSTLYHIMHDGEEKIAIALPDGQTLIIALANPDGMHSRRLEDTKKGSAV
jgi:hypothetical protein